MIATEHVIREMKLVVKHPMLMERKYIYFYNY